MEDHDESTVLVDETLPMILCCLCGTKIQSNPSNTCVQCLRGQVDITSGITKSLVVFYCRGCGRYQRPPWVRVELESRELLALLLKKIRGIGKEVKLVDANFVWTEPHSRRIKVKLTVQKQVMNSAILQQTTVVEFVVTNMQCEECAASYTEHTWGCVVQVRQRVEHKRTFFWLEQLMLKHGVTDKVQNIKEQPEGLDFFWATKSNANTFLSWLQQHVPTRVKASKRLISADLNSNTQKFKFAYHVEISPLCKHDLVVLPPRTASLLGGIHPLLLCTKMTSSVHLVDPLTLQAAEMNSDKLWHYSLESALTSKQLTEFVVLDVERASANALNPSVGGAGHRKYALAEVQCMRASDLGVTDRILTTTTHLGHLLQPGDHVLGYDLQAANFNEAHMASFGQRGEELPDVVLVKKHYVDSHRARARKRTFQLRQLPKEAPDRAPKKHEIQRAENDYEEFLRDIEEDPETWDQINMYRRALGGDEDAGAAGAAGAADGADDDEQEDAPPTVPLDKLLEDMGNLTMGVGGGDDDDEEEEDGGDDAEFDEMDDDAEADQ